MIKNKIGFLRISKKNEGYNQEGFTVLELAMAISVLVILSAVSLWAFPSIDDWSKDSQAKMASSVAYKSSLNALTNPWTNMTVEEAINETANEYKNTEISVLGDDLKNLCVTTTIKGDVEGKYTTSRGACPNSAGGDSSGDGGDSGGSTPIEEPKIENTITKLNFQCDATTTQKLPFQGIKSGSTIVVSKTSDTSDLGVLVPIVDGTSDLVTMNAGIGYTAVLDGEFDGLVTSPSNFSGCLTEVEKIEEDTGAKKISFSGSAKLIAVPESIPSSVTDLKEAFYQASSFNDPKILSWDTKNVTDMTSMFEGAVAFSQNISNWNVNKVTMRSQFDLNSGLAATQTPNWEN